MISIQKFSYLGPVWYNFLKMVFIVFYITVITLLTNIFFKETSNEKLVYTTFLGTYHNKSIQVFHLLI